MVFDISLLGVVLAAVASMAVGGLWYSPLLFGNKWMELGGITQEQIDKAKQKGMWKMYVTSFFVALVTAYVLSHFVEVWRTVQGGINAMGAFTLGFWVWLGFMATVLVGQVLWEDKPWGYFVINAVYQLVAVLVMVTVLILI